MCYINLSVIGDKRKLLRPRGLANLLPAAFRLLEI